jgi:hypothetical protein
MVFDRFWRMARLPGKRDQFRLVCEYFLPEWRQNLLAVDNDCQ